MIFCYLVFITFLLLMHYHNSRFLKNHLSLIFTLSFIYSLVTEVMGFVPEIPHLPIFIPTTTQFLASFNFIYLSSFSSCSPLPSPGTNVLPPKGALTLFHFYFFLGTFLIKLSPLWLASSSLLLLSLSPFRWKHISNLQLSWTVISFLGFHLVASISSTHHHHE